MSFGCDPLGRRAGTGGTFARLNLPDAVSDTTYDAHRLTEWGTSTLTYDDAGNLTDDGTHTYAYNPRGQLANTSGGQASSFAYDALGRRTRATTGGQTVNYLYDGLTPIRETIGTTTRADMLTAGSLDGYLARTEDGQTSSYLSDALGSTVALADQNRQITTSYTYDPYANASATGSSTNGYQFTGSQHDSGGLNYMRARYPNPETGRFTQEDPLGTAAGPNTYTYANSSPQNHTDPLGLFSPAGPITSIGCALLCPKLAQTVAAFGDGLHSATEFLGQRNWGDLLAAPVNVYFAYTAIMAAQGMLALSALGCGIPCGIGAAAYAGFALGRASRVADNLATGFSPCEQHCSTRHQLWHFGLDVAPTPIGPAIRCSDDACAKPLRRLFDWSF